MRVQKEKVCYHIELVDDWKINGAFIEIIVGYFSTYTLHQETQELYLSDESTFGFLVKEASNNVIEFLAGNQQTDGFENWFSCWPCDKLVNDWDVRMQMFYV